MNCKFCNAQIGEDHKFCPYCGKSLDEIQEQSEEEIVDRPEGTAEAADGAEAVQTMEAVEEPAPKKKGKVWKLVLAIAGGVVALGVLAVVLLYAFGVKLIPDNDVFVKDSYTSGKMKPDAVVAKVGDRELTNSLLQVYYMSTVNSFAEYYSSYIDYIGLDVGSDLSKQTCYFDETMTWEQFFIEEALNQWYTFQVTGMVADEAGYTLSEEWKTALEAMPQELESSAAESGYDSALAMLQYVYGENCTVETYLDYANTYYYANAFNASIYEITDADIEAYFTENEATFAESGITKESGTAGTVRHILISPEGGTTDDAGVTTYSDSEWQACLEKAQQVLDEWKAGEATEDTFAEMVATYSADAGSTSTGGLYENVVADGTYMEEFEAWAVDTSRQAGDVEIIKTSYGYHIMYYVSGKAEWLHYAETGLLDERYNAQQDAISAKTEVEPLKVNYRKIVLG